MQKNDQNSFKIEDEEKSIQNNIGWRAIIGGTLLHLVNTSITILKNI